MHDLYSVLGLSIFCSLNPKLKNNPADTKNTNKSQPSIMVEHGKFCIFFLMVNKKRHTIVAPLPLDYGFLNPKRRISGGDPALRVGNLQRLQIANLNQLLHHLRNIFFGVPLIAGSLHDS